MTAKAKRQSTKSPPTRAAARSRRDPDSRSSGDLPPSARRQPELTREELELEHETLLRRQGKLEASREHYANLYEFAPIGYLTLSQRGAILKINLTGAHLLGHPREHLDGKPFLHFISKPDRRKYLRHLSLCRQKQGDRLSTELWLTPNAKGRSLCVELISNTSTGLGREDLVYNSVLVDATRRKEAEEALQRAHHELEKRVRDRTRQLSVSNAALKAEIAERVQAQEVLRASEKNLVDFFNHSPFGLLWVSPRGRILRVNQAGLELFGCSLTECLGESVRTFYVDSQVAEESLRRLEQRDVLQHLRTRVHRRDGQMRHVLIDANGLWEEGRMVHSRWFIRDITRRMELEREILVIAEREQRRIGRDLHDDLCQQLTGIQFLSQTLASELSGQTKDGAKRAREIAKLVRQAITRTRELAHGLSPVELDTVGLPEALQELAERTRKLFHVNCRFRCKAPRLNLTAEQGIHLYRIAQEAVGNALKHGQATRVDIALTRNKKRLILAVKDNGVGASPKAPQKKGMGLRVMQYRTDVINGSLVFQKNPKRGMTLVCSISDEKE